MPCPAAAAIRVSALHNPFTRTTAEDELQSLTWSCYLYGEPSEISQDLFVALYGLQVGEFSTPKKGHRSLDQAAEQRKSSLPPAVFKAYTVEQAERGCCSFLRKLVPGFGESSLPSL